MSRETSATKDGGPGAPRHPAPPDAIRNVVVVGHSGSGKTTLVEALLAHTGAVARGLLKRGLQRGAQYGGRFVTRKARSPRPYRRYSRSPEVGFGNG